MVPVSALVLCLVLSAASALAEPIRVGGCPQLEPYKPDADVNYQPGVDAKGWAVAPADIAPSPIDAQQLGTANIELDLPLDAHVNESAMNLNTDQARIGVGQLQIDPSGEAQLNGQPLNPHEAPIHPDCLRDK